MQPGTTMKPVTFAAWLGEGKTTHRVEERRRGLRRQLPLEDHMRARPGGFDSTPKIPASTDLQNDEPG